VWISTGACTADRPEICGYLLASHVRIFLFRGFMPPFAAWRRSTALSRNVDILGITV